MTITIGIDPHKASHTAVAIDDTEHVVDEIRVRACSAQTDQLRCWATPFPARNGRDWLRGVLRTHVQVSELAARTRSARGSSLIAC